MDYNKTMKRMTILSYVVWGFVTLAMVISAVAYFRAGNHSASMATLLWFINGFNVGMGLALKKASNDMKRLNERMDAFIRMENEELNRIDKQLKDAGKRLAKNR